MTRTPEYSTQFQRYVKRLEKRGKDMAKLKALLILLITDTSLLSRHKDHALKGNWIGFQDAHVEPDWILIYSLRDGFVRFERTGTHSDLFD